MERGRERRRRRRNDWHNEISQHRKLTVKKKILRQAGAAGNWTRDHSVTSAALSYPLSNNYGDRAEGIILLPTSLTWEPPWPSGKVRR